MGTNSCRLTRRGSELRLPLVHTTLCVTEPMRAPCGQSLGRGELAAHRNEVGKEQNWSRERETGSTFPGRRGRSPSRREQRQGGEPVTSTAQPLDEAVNCPAWAFVQKPHS